MFYNPVFVAYRPLLTLRDNGLPLTVANAANRNTEEARNPE